MVYYVRGRLNRAASPAGDAKGLARAPYRGDWVVRNFEE
jgi:hypothetical protein